MTTTTADIVLLAALAGLVLLALTVMAEVLRARHGASLSAQTFATRVESWWAMVVLFALALIIGPLGIVLLTGFAAFAALREYVTYAHSDQADHLALAAAFYLVLPLQFLFVYMDWPALMTVFIPVYAFLLLPVLSVLRGQSRNFLMRVSRIQWGLMVCVFALSHLPAMMWLKLGVAPGRMVLMIAFVVVVVQSADLVDFFAGRRIGRHRVLPALSPRTWEGLAVALVFAAGMGAALSWTTPFGLGGSALLGALAFVAGVCGKFVLAAIKRDMGLRDWSHLIPGQGGVLDQLDSVIFAAPVVYHLTRLWWG